MNKNDLIKLLDELFSPIGFKRKGNYWLANGNILSKMINLQKSSFGNHYFINYGYILKVLPLNNETMHIYNRVAAIEKDEQKRITDLLDLKNDIPDDKRLLELKKLLIDRIVSKIQLINTEEDVLNELKKRPHLNDISLVVKKYFNL
jgi:hypothetical protein